MPVIIKDFLSFLLAIKIIAIKETINYYKSFQAVLEWSTLQGRVTHDLTEQFLNVSTMFCTCMPRDVQLVLATAAAQSLKAMAMYARVLSPSSLSFACATYIKLAETHYHILKFTFLGTGFSCSWSTGGAAKLWV